MLITLYMGLNKAVHLCVSGQCLLLQQSTDWAISKDRKFTACLEAGMSQVEAPCLGRVTLRLDVAVDISAQRH